ncbi:MAG: ABC transporter permease, partial [Candidatus Caldatribacteriaceae bacterium]
VWWLLLPIGFWFLFFLFVPLFLVLWESVHGEQGFDLSAYAGVFVRKLYRESLKNSLVLSVSTTFLGTFIGLPLSYALYRTEKGIKEFILALLALPLTFSGLVIAYAFIILLGNSGFITILLSRLFGIDTLEFSSFLFTWRGLLVAYLYFLIPRMILTMIAAWSEVDWSLLEAAEILGMKRTRAFFRVIFPLIRPSLLAGSSLLFAVSMGAFGTAFALVGTGVNIMPLLIYTQMSEISVNLQEANALAVILVAVTTTVVLVYERALARRF